MDLKDRLSAALTGRYEIEREIGRGGMAMVYLARDLKLQRRVAIKVLRPEFSASLIADRFVQEIQIAARLEHPLILKLYESDSSDGLLWYAMPYIKGETLHDRLRRERQLAVDEAVRITCEVAEALSYAHGQGVLHRDIKPANILFSDGHPLVADFGIAKAFTEAGGPTHTATAVGIGTPGYMSPEQATGEKNIDPRTDVYSLACVLYEMLAGETPYTGPTAQAIIAKQLSLPVPSVRTVRETVPAGVDYALRRGLAKVPADRFPSVQAFVQALRSSRREPIRWTTVAAIAALPVMLVAAWVVTSSRVTRLNENRVVVFPLAQTGGGRLPASVGEAVARVIIGALERTEPLKWLDGWIWLEEREREDVRRLTSREAHRISRAQRARFELAGSIAERGDSASVSLWLYDVAADSIVSQHTASGSADVESVVQLGLQTVARLIPSLVETGRHVDLTELTERDPSAIALWVQGEVEYRHARFLPALDFYRRAVERDSALAMAALKGAQAASWKAQFGEAERFVSAALLHEGGLPARHRHFAQGLRMYLTGQADSAVARLRAAVELDGEWTDAWMALGEVYYHLQPGAVNRDSLAQVSFETAAAYDPEFTPALVHLAQTAVWNRDLGTSERLLSRLSHADPDTNIVRQLSLMLQCVRNGPRRTAWDEAAVGNPDRALQASAALAARAQHPECAKAGFRAYLAGGKGDQIGSWDALLGLQGILIAEGKLDSVAHLLDSAVAAGLDWANMLYVVDAIEGVNVAGQAEGYVAQFRGDYRAVQFVTRLWALGVWEAHGDKAEVVAAIAAELDRRATATSGRQSRLLADIFAARAAVLRADTIAAVSQLEALRPTARRNDLFWSPFEGLAAERLLLAELLAAGGKPRQALQVLGEFDQQTAPLSYLMYLPRSFALGARVAQAAGDRQLAQAYRNRLLALGRSELVHSP